MGDPEAQVRHPHPMPGWVAVAVIPAPAEGDPVCASCGKRHPQGEEHGHPLMQLFGQGPPATVIVRAVVLEVGNAPEHLVPFGEGSTVHYPEGAGMMIGDASFLVAQTVIGWEDA